MFVFYTEQKANASGAVDNFFAEVLDGVKCRAYEKSIRICHHWAS